MEACARQRAHDLAEAPQAIRVGRVVEVTRLPAQQAVDALRNRVVVEEEELPGRLQDSGDSGCPTVEVVDSLEPRLSSKAANGQDIINFRNGINAQYAFLLGQIEGNDVLTQPSRERFDELEKAWSELRARVEALESQQLPAFNKLLQDAGLVGVIIPPKKGKVVM